MASTRITILFQATLTVVSTTTIAEGPVDMASEVRSPVTMDCLVLWDPTFKLTVTWKKDNVDIDMSGRFSKDETTNALTIDDLEFGDSGKAVFTYCTAR